MSKENSNNRTTELDGLHIQQISAAVDVQMNAAFFSSSFWFHSFCILGFLGFFVLTAGDSPDVNNDCY